MSALNKTIMDGTVIWKVVKRIPDPFVYTPENLGVYRKEDTYSKTEINSLLDLYVLKTGGTITGTLNVNKLIPTSIVIPTSQGEGNFWIG